MKSYQAFFQPPVWNYKLITSEMMEKSQYGEIKQHGTEQLLGQWRNQKRNKKVPEDKFKWKYAIPKSMWCSKNNSKREVYSNTGLPQEIRKISKKKKQSKLTPKEVKKKKQSPKSVEGRK